MNKRNAYFKSNLKTRAEPEGKYIEGYFAIFNQETELWDGTFEKIAPGAFAKSLTDNDIRCLFNHNTDIVMGRTGANTLELKEDNYGLWGRIRINEEDTEALAIYARVCRKDISGCSFGFYPESESYEEKEDGYHWTVNEANTQEVSICTFPAYPQTEIQARQQELNETEKRKLMQLKEKLKKRVGEIHVKTIEN